jgi:hypothetical protein
MLVEWAGLDTLGKPTVHCMWLYEGKQMKGKFGPELLQFITSGEPGSER